MKNKLLSNEKFGPFIRKLRLEKKIGQRELAKKIGVAPSYLNDMEKGKRTAPKNELINSLSNGNEIKFHP